MFIKITPSSGIPLYRQIMDQIRLAVATGRVRPGDKLPSIRDLSQTLEISPITVVKAYSELEHLGVVETRRGRGTFVAEASTLIGYHDRLRAAEELLEGTALDLAALDLPPDTVCGVLREKLESLEKAKEGGSVHG
jgi:GntR family transcriptional regulator